MDKRDYLDLATAGGYPEAAARSPNRRSHWFESYIKTLIHRDLRHISEIERFGELPKILRIVGARTANMMNVNSLGRDSGVPPTTLRLYITLLETTFVIRLVPAWSNNKTTRVIRSPKIFVMDTGLAAHLLGATAAGLAQPGGNAGQIMETFVMMELGRQLGWSSERTSLHHLRTKEQVEVDGVIESADGRVACVEVKASATVTSSDFAGHRYLAAKAGTRFVAGVVLYTGPEPLSFGKNLFAVPISALWDCR